MSRRTERLGSTIRQELMSIIQRELADPRITGLPSITRVKVAEDLSTADIFLTVMGTPGQQKTTLNALKHSAGMMRLKLLKALSIRQVPFLNFQFDEQLKKELATLELIEMAARENAELDRKRAEHAAAAAALAEGAPTTEAAPATPAAGPVEDGRAADEHG